MAALYVWLKSWLGSEEGQDLVEYGLLVALVAFVVILGVSLFGANLLDWFNGIAGTVAGWNR